MASKPYGWNNKVTRAVSTSGNVYGKHTRVEPRSPFGPMVAQEIFELYGGEVDCEPISEDEYNYSKPVSAEEYWYQLDLPLENLRELEERMRSQIRKFERAYDKMADYALRWHYLLTDVEENPQIKKMFGDVQLTRKLSGSDTV